MHSAIAIRVVLDIDVIENWAKCNISFTYVQLCIILYDRLDELEIHLQLILMNAKFYWFLPLRI